MPIYHFKLRDGSLDKALHKFRLGSKASAVKHAYQVVRELMRNREQQVRHWQLEIYSHKGPRFFSIAFAQADRTLDHFSPEMRAEVLRHYKGRLELAELLTRTQLILRQSRSLIARSRGKPFLVSENGQRLAEH